MATTITDNMSMAFDEFTSQDVSDSLVEEHNQSLSIWVSTGPNSITSEYQFHQASLAKLLQSHNFHLYFVPPVRLHVCLVAPKNRHILYMNPLNSSPFVRMILELDRLSPWTNTFHPLQGENIKFSSSTLFIDSN